METKKTFQGDELKMIEWLSPTSITKFISDQKGWFEQKILKIPLRSIYLTGGSAVHKFLEDFFMFDPKRGETLLQFKERRMSELLPHLPDFKDQNGETLKDLVEEFGEQVNYTFDDIERWLNVYFDRWYNRARPDEIKKGTKYAWKQHTPFKSEMALKNETLKLRGYVDAFLKDYWNYASNTAINIVLDYKTSKQNNSTVHTDYFLQMKLYALMITQLGTPVHKVCIEYVKTGDREFLPIDKKQLELTEDLVKEVWKEIKTRGLDINNYLDKRESKQYGAKWMKYF